VKSAAMVPPAPAAAARGDSTQAEIERSFKEFRESAVRLAERVSDMSHTAPEDPIEAARQDLQLLRTIFGKWSPEVLVALHAAPAEGFESLRRSLIGISPRVLSLKLKELESNGMVLREVVDARPPRVRYTLTDRGWTVAWLTQPVLLYLRHSQPPGTFPPSHRSAPAR
jgi:DNA-binding HxlR family transcriptional regulator